MGARHHGFRICEAPIRWEHSEESKIRSGDYLRFRLVTQYGDDEHAPEPDDVLNYLRWCRHWDR